MTYFSIIAVAISVIYLVALIFETKPVRKKLTDENILRVREFLNANNTPEALKYIRQQSGCSLIEAKNFIEILSPTELQQS